MDITSDSTHSVFFRIFEGAPKYVAEAEVPTKEAADRLPDSLFADSFNRRYPIDSKAATWLSAAYFAKTAEDDGYGVVTKEYVENRIKEAADRYGNREDVDKVMEKLRAKPVVKKASDDESNYGWPKERKYPMFDERGVKLACSYFDENAYNYPPTMRHTIAKNIMRKCAEYGMLPTRTVRVEAGSGLNLRDSIGAALVDRIRACTNEKSAELLRATSEMLMHIDSGDMFHEMSVKMAEALEEFDIDNGFHRMYNARFESPAAIFFGLSVKAAADRVEDTVVLGKDAFSITKLAELPLEVFTSCLGEDFGERVKSAEGIDRGKLADELHSLPMPDKKALLKSIREYAA